MYTREEASKIRQEFWTVFGHYLSPYTSLSGEKVNWVNYKTGIRHIYFKMDADKRNTFIGIYITHPDAGIQELFYEQLLEYKKLLENATGEIWVWEPLIEDQYGKIISKIYRDMSGVNIFNKNDWPKIISFLKPRLLALDDFWNDVKDGFEALK